MKLPDYPNEFQPVAELVLGDKVRSFTMKRVLAAGWPLVFMLLLSTVCQGCVRPDSIFLTAAPSVEVSASIPASITPSPVPSPTPRGGLSMVLQAKTALENRFLYRRCGAFSSLCQVT